MMIRIQSHGTMDDKRFDIDNFIRLPSWQQAACCTLFLFGCDADFKWFSFFKDDFFW
jgi:hypothetical protein